MRSSVRLFGAVAMGSLLAAACTTDSLDLTTPTPGLSPTPTATGTVTPTPVPTPFGNGDGHDGPFAPGGATKVTTCQRALTASGTTITVSDATGLAAGKYLVLQVQDDFSTESSAAPVTNAGDAGKFELVEVSSIVGTTLTTATAMSGSYDSAGTRSAQVCRMHEYTTVTLAGGGTLTTDPWDGSRGGVIAFFATGAVSVGAGGGIIAKGAGFRGGVVGIDGNGQHSTAEDTGNGDGGGKGEGADRRGVGLFGRGNFGNGAGGGNTRDSGGGGGSNGGAGGFGGKGATGVGTPTLDSRGRGGAPLDISATQRLFFGGGGGAGHESDGIATAGANGGGLILIFAGSFAGSGGLIDVGGATALDSGDVAVSAHDGAGGGGGGGTMVIVAASSTFSGILSARGGGGGDSNGSDPNDHGPGGGGGGGRVVTGGFNATVDVTAGARGINGLSGSPNDGANGADGVYE